MREVIDALLLGAALLAAVILTVGVVLAPFLLVGGVLGGFLSFLSLWLIVGFFAIFKAEK